jgi:hypothetical protein
MSRLAGLRIRSIRAWRTASLGLLALGCGVVMTAAAASAAPGGGLVAVCRGTGDPSIPYVPLMATPAQARELASQPGNIVPAPPGGCPTHQESGSAGATPVLGAPTTAVTLTTGALITTTAAVATATGAVTTATSAATSPSAGGAGASLTLTTPASMPTRTAAAVTPTTRAPTAPRLGTSATAGATHGTPEAVAPSTQTSAAAAPALTSPPVASKRRRLRLTQRGRHRVDAHGRTSRAALARRRSAAARSAAPVSPGGASIRFATATPPRSVPTVPQGPGPRAGAEVAGGFDSVQGAGLGLIGFGVCVLMLIPLGRTPGRRRFVGQRA